MSMPTTDAGIRKVGRLVGRIDGSPDLPPTPPIEQSNSIRHVGYLDGSPVEAADEGSAARRILKRERAGVAVVTSSAAANLFEAKAARDESETVYGSVPSDHNKARVDAAKRDFEFADIRHRRLAEKLADCDRRLDDEEAIAALDRELEIAQKPLAVNQDARAELHRAAKVIVEAHAKLVEQAEAAQTARSKAQAVARRLKIPESELRIRSPEAADARIVAGREFVNGLRAIGQNPHRVADWLLRYGL